MVVFDGNDTRLYKWVHARIDRMTRIIFLHMQYAQRKGAESLPMYQSAMVGCLSWHERIKGQARFREWLDRLSKAQLEPPSADDGANRESANVLSAQDRLLGRMARPILGDVNDAVQALLQMRLDQGSGPLM
jgi:hypothetical protein